MGDKVSISVGISVNYADKPGNLIKLHVQGFEGEVGGIARAVESLLKPALFHLQQIDEAKA